MARWLRCLAAAAALLPNAASLADGPSVWLIDGGTNRIYVTGSVHLLKPGQYKSGGALERAYTDAERLVMELDLDDLDSAQATAATTALAVDPSGRDLETLLGAEAAPIKAAAAAAGVDLTPYARFEPWYAGVSVTTLGFLRQGLQLDLGVEQVLAQRARTDHKPIDGLETLTAQLAALDAMSLPLQAQFLLTSLEDLRKPAAPLDALVRAWQAGDDAALGAQLAAEFDGSPDLYSALLVGRNRHFADGIAAYAGRQDDVLVVIGAMHLVGKDSVLGMLAARGLPARRVAAAN